MIPKISRRLSQAVMAAALLLICGAAPLRAQTVAVMVNGEAITNFDIEQRMKLSGLSGQQVTRQSVIEDLINEKVKVKEGKKFSVDPGASEVEGAFASMSSRMRMSSDQLVAQLASKGIRPDTLRAG